MPPVIRTPPMFTGSISTTLATGKLRRPRRSLILLKTPVDAAMTINRYRMVGISTPSQSEAHKAGRVSRGYGAMQELEHSYRFHTGVNRHRERACLILAPSGFRHGR